MVGRRRRSRLHGSDIDSASMTETSPTPAELPSNEPLPTVESAFDVWLNRGLHQLFDDVAKEPIPDELLKLILDDKNK